MKRKEKLSTTAAPPTLTTPTSRPSLGSRLKSIRESKAKEKKKQLEQEQLEGQLSNKQQQKKQLLSEESKMADTADEEAMATAKTIQHVNVYREEKTRFSPKVPKKSVKQVIIKEFFRLLFYGVTNWPRI